MNRAAAAAALVLLAACSRGDADAPALGEVREIASPAAAGGAEPNLAVGADGRVYLSWLETGADSVSALRFAVLEGERWSAPRTVASGRGWVANWADFPSLAVLPGGKLAAHWLQRSGAGRYAYDVHVARSADGGATWTAGTVPYADRAPAEHGFVSLWPAAGDSVGAVWLDGRKFAGREEGAPGAETMLVTASLTADGAAGAERILDARICDCCQTAAAMTADGPLIVYRDRSPAEIRDIYAVRQVRGAWTAPAPVHADGWHMPACPVNGPAVSADGRLTAVAWFTGEGEKPRVQVAFSDDGGATFAAPVRVDGGAPLGRVDVEMVPGGALVSWVEQGDGGAAAVRVRRLDRSGTMGDPRTVAASSAERSSGFPRMARSGNRVVFAWTVPGKPSAVRVAAMALGEKR